MGLKNFLDRFKKKSEEPENTDPLAAKKAEKERTRRNAERAAKAFGLAKKGLDTFNAGAEKARDIKDTIKEKISGVAEKATPAAEKVDEAAADVAAGKVGQTVSKIGDTAKSALDAAKNGLKAAVNAAGEKATAAKEEAAQKPSTGSTLLDILLPAVPETDATKPKAKKADDTPPSPPAAA